MTFILDNPDYPPAAPTPLPTDTLADSVLILLGLSVVQRLIGFVRAVLFCRWLDPEQLGLWDMAFSFLLLAAPLAVLAIPGSFGRYLEHYRRRGQLRRFLRWTMLACGGLAVAACAGILWARQWFSALIFGSPDQAEMVALAAACLLAVVAYNFLIEMFTALRTIRLVSVMQLVNSVAFAVLGVALLLTWRCGAASVLAAYGGSCLIAAVWAGCRLLRVWHAAPAMASPAPHAAFWAKVVPFAAWVLLASVLINLFGVVDRYMILHFSRTPAAAALDAVGNYHSSRVVPLLLVSIAAMLSTMITPHLSHDWEAGKHELVAARLRLFLKLFGFVLYAGAVAVLLAAPLLFTVAFRGKFPCGEAVLPWTLMYCTWFGLWLVMQNYLLCAEKARLASAALACGLILNVLLNLLLLPRLGLEGAILSTAAANALSLGLTCLFNHRLGFHLDHGAMLVILLPALLCLGPWVALLALLLVAADALWVDRLLSPEEKRQVAESVAQYVKRFGFGRVPADSTPGAVGR
jgi:O-antigen/teichoic acid export membrane protein